MDLKGPSRAIVNLGILSLTLVVVVIISEFAVRYVFSDVTTTSDNWSYFATRWRRSKVRLNRLGFREREFDFAKPPGVYRIAVIGDSFTFGQGIDEEARFSNLIRQRLNDWKGAYDVLNFGRAGTETVHHLKILTGLVLWAAPDFVLLQWYINDVETDKSRRPRPWPLLPSRRLAAKLRPVSALYYLLDYHWVTLQAELGWMGSYEADMREQFGDPESPASITAQKLLKQFLTTCKQREVSVGMVVFGDSYGRPSALDFLVDRVLSLCAEEAITCVDTRQIFAPYEDVQQLWANRLDPHPGPLANRLVADRVLDVFGRVWSRGAPAKQ
jgi:hypothetical protein